ncbi:hypothetical protein HDU96_011096, partial [Phlyctochytrium bullatum]
MVKGKIALVTGSASGFGKALAERLTSLGAKVVASDINAADGEAAVRELVQKHGKDAAYFIQCNVADPKDLDELFKKAVQKYGRLDIVVNNAGIGEVVRLLESPGQKWRKIIDVNVNGKPFLLFPSSAPGAAPRHGPEPPPSTAPPGPRRAPARPPAGDKKGEGRCMSKSDSRKVTWREVTREDAGVGTERGIPIAYETAAHGSGVQFIRAMFGELVGEGKAAPGAEVVIGWGATIEAFVGRDWGGAGMDGTIPRIGERGEGLGPESRRCPGVEQHAPDAVHGGAPEAFDVTVDLVIFCVGVVALDAEVTAGVCQDVSTVFPTFIHAEPPDLTVGLAFQPHDVLPNRGSDLALGGDEGNRCVPGVDIDDAEGIFGAREGGHFGHDEEVQGDNVKGVGGGGVGAGGERGLGALGLNTVVARVVGVGWRMGTNNHPPGVLGGGMDVPVVEVMEAAVPAGDWGGGGQEEGLGGVGGRGHGGRDDVEVVAALAMEEG